MDGNVVVAVIDGEMTIKRLQLGHGRMRLAAENPAYEPVFGIFVALTEFERKRISPRTLAGPVNFWDTANI